MNHILSCPSCGHRLIDSDLNFGYCFNCLYEFDDFDFEIFNQDNE